VYVDAIFCWRGQYTAEKLDNDESNVIVNHGYYFRPLASLRHHTV
jgi:hypothetical protein